MIDQIRTRIRSSLDTGYYNGLYSAACQYAGMQSSIREFSGDSFPHWKVLNMTQQCMGDTHYARDELMTLLGAITSRPVVPEFPEILSDTLRALRGAYFSSCLRGHSYREPWEPAHREFALWGLGFGLGGLAITMQKGPDDALYVHHEAIEGVNLLYDRHAKDPANSRWMAYFQYLGVEDALDMYGSRVKSNILMRQHEFRDDGISDAEYEAVRVLHYYDPEKYVCFLEDHNGVVLLESENPMGFIPIAIMTGDIVPLSRNRIGVVQKTLPIQAQLQRIERMDMMAIENPAIDVISRPSIDDSQFAEAMAKDPPDARIFTDRQLTRDELPSARIPGIELSPANIEIYNRIKREKLPQASGVNDMMRGELSDTQRTAQEVNEVASQSSGRVSALKNAYALAMGKAYTLTSFMAHAFESAPLPLSISGQTVILNSGNPDLTSETLFEDYSAVVINPEDLFGADAKKAKLERGQDLDQLIALAQIAPNVLDISKLIDKKIESLGFEPASIKHEAGQMPTGGAPVSGIPVS